MYGEKSFNPCGMGDLNAANVSLVSVVRGHSSWDVNCPIAPVYVLFKIKAGAPGRLVD